MSHIVVMSHIHDHVKESLLPMECPKTKLDVVEESETSWAYYVGATAISSHCTGTFSISWQGLEWCGTCHRGNACRVEWWQRVLGGSVVTCGVGGYVCSKW